MTTSYFPTADEMREILGPVARDAEEQLGSKASIHTIARVKRLDGSFGPAAPVAGETLVPVRLESITLERAQEIFGLETDVLMQGTTQRGYGIALGVIFKVTEGDFLGATFEVIKIVEEPLSDSYVLGLKEHGAVV